MSRFESFFDHLGIRPGSGADPGRLREIEKRFNLSLPDEIHEFYQARNGLDIDGGALRFLTVDGIEEYARVFQPASAGLNFGWLPFTDSNDSNPYALSCAGPTRGMVIHVFHDDSPSLVSRSFISFLAAIEDTLQRLADGEDDEDTAIDRIPGELAINSPERTEEDARIGRELIQLAARIDPLDDTRDMALRFAVELFGHGHEADLVNLLESDVWDHARSRLQYLTTTEAARAVKSFDAQAARFIEDVASAIRKRGIEVVQVHGIHLNLRQGAKSMWLNTPIWIGRRREKGIVEVIVERARELLAQKR